MLLFTSDPLGARPWRPNWVIKQFIDARRRSGVSLFRLHDLHHFMATEMLNAGVPIPIVSARLAQPEPPPLSTSTPTPSPAATTTPPRQSPRSWPPVEVSLRPGRGGWFQTELLSRISGVAPSELRGELGIVAWEEPAPDGCTAAAHA